MTNEELVVRLLEEGVSVSVLAKASDIPEADLYDLGIVDKSESLPEAAVELAWLAIDKGKQILRTGSQTNQVRLVATIFTHVMRSYKGESPKAFANLQDYIAGVLRGEEVEFDADNLPDA